MFTGIIEAVAEVKNNDPKALSLSRPALFDDVTIGASIAVSGVCLTITDLSSDEMRFVVIPETLSKTKLGTLTAGSTVNLERALPAQGRFDGHIVQGHTECVAQVETISTEPYLMSISLPQDVADLCIDRGSIAIDGVSLTIAKKDGNTVTVALIPHTLAQTTLGQLRIGDQVNIEPDILARYVLRNSSSSHGK